MCTPKPPDSAVPSVRLSAKDHFILANHLPATEQVKLLAEEYGEIDIFFMKRQALCDMPREYQCAAPIPKLFESTSESIWIHLDD